MPLLAFRWAVFIPLLFNSGLLAITGCNLSVNNGDLWGCGHRGVSQQFNLVLGYSVSPKSLCPDLAVEWVIPLGSYGSLLDQEFSGTNYFHCFTGSMREYFCST